VPQSKDFVVGATRTFKLIYDYWIPDQVWNDRDNIAFYLNLCYNNINSSSCDEVGGSFHRRLSPCLMG
jgi:hypothetical protein